MASEIDKGPDGLLDRIFALMVKELELADPRWCQAIALGTLNADTLRDARFEDRKSTVLSPGRSESERSGAQQARKRTVAGAIPCFVCMKWYRPSSLHSMSMTESGLNRGWSVCLSIIMPPFHRSLSAGYWRCARQGSLAWSHSVMITTGYRQRSDRHHHGKSYRFDVFIDARGQKPLRNKDIPFPTLRKQLAGTGDDVPDVGKTIRCWRRHHCGGVSLWGDPG